MRLKIIFISIISLSFFFAKSQSLGSYTFAFKNKQINISHSFTTISDAKQANAFINDYLALQNWENLSVALSYERHSLGAHHYTFQVYYNSIAVEFCQIKLHTTKDKKPFYIQHNLPDKERWNTFQQLSYEENSNVVVLIHEQNAVAARKEMQIDEATDLYANSYTLTDGSYFENSLKHHADSTVHVKVFNPDPLSTANQNYGGLYQDSYTKDTSILVLQSITNPNTNTVTFNSTDYTLNGQLFTINAESYLNSFSGSTLYQYLTEVRFNGLGGIIGYNTAITDNQSGLTTQLITDDYNYPSLANEQEWRTMTANYNAGTFSLKNDAFRIAEISPPVTNIATSTTDTFDFTRNELGFEDANTFYHLNTYKEYWESLGFTDLAQQIILVDPHGNNGADNSFFTSTSPPRLVFGQGGVDDAEDADVVIHEYGHAISYFASPNSNTGSERNAIDEGFGDYVATSYSYGLNTFNWDRVFSWDGHNEFWSGRFANSAKTSLDISATQNIYFNGEIWATVLTDLLLDIGKTDADKLAIEIMYYNMPNTTIYEAALNLFKADSTIFNGVYRCDIFTILQARHFLLGDCNDFYSSIANSYAQSNQVKLLNSAYFNAQQPLQVLIEDKNFTQGSYYVVNAAGQLISTQTIHQKRQAIDTRNWSNGVYFIVLKTNTDTYRFKVVKQDE